MAAWPTLPRHPRDVEKLAGDCANNSLDAARMGCSGGVPSGRWAGARGSGEGSEMTVRVTRMGDALSN